MIGLVSSHGSGGACRAFFLTAELLAIDRSWVKELSSCPVGYVFWAHWAPNPCSNQTTLVKPNVTKQTWRELLCGKSFLSLLPETSSELRWVNGHSPPPELLVYVAAASAGCFWHCSPWALMLFHHSRDSVVCIPRGDLCPSHRVYALRVPRSEEKRRSRSPWRASRRLSDST